MMRKLRMKFVAAAMLSLFTVLIIIIGSINIINYNDIVNKADTTLSLLQNNDGKFPARDEKKGESAMPRMQPIPPELPYASRFFSVIVDDDGNIVSSDTDNISAVDETEAAELAKEAISEGKQSDFSGKYRYIINEHKDGTQVIFLDCTNDLSTFHTFLIVSCSISLVGLLAVFVLMVLLSSRIIKPIAESYEKQRRFITDAGHEIKTPITIIDADAEVLEMDMPNNEWLQDIRTQTRRLTSLTNDLIFLSRMDEEQLKIQTIDFPLSDLVNETAQSFQALAKTQNKDFSIKVEPMITMNGDEKSLRQLISILLENALKYSKEEGHIILSLRKTGKVIQLTVTNSTEAITKGNLNFLFERFYRTDQSRNSSTGGYGLGLSIAKAVVAAHKGKITAHSTDGSSVTIDVLLPEQPKFINYQ